MNWFLLSWKHCKTPEISKGDMFFTKFHFSSQLKNMERSFKIVDIRKSVWLWIISKFITPSYPNSRSFRSPLLLLIMSSFFLQTNYLHHSLEIIASWRLLISQIFIPAEVHERMWLSPWKTNWHLKFATTRSDKEVADNLLTHIIQIFLWHQEEIYGND